MYMQWGIQLINFNWCKYIVRVHVYTEAFSFLLGGGGGIKFCTHHGRSNHLVKSKVCAVFRYLEYPVQTHMWEWKHLRQCNFVVKFQLITDARIRRKLEHENFTHEKSLWNTCEIHVLITRKCANVRLYMYMYIIRECWPWFGGFKVDKVSSLVALEVILLVDLHRQVEVSLTPLLTTKCLQSPKNPGRGEVVSQMILLGKNIILILPMLV